MAFGVLGAAVGGITITGAESVAKTFPTFWDALKRVGVKVKLMKNSFGRLFTITSFGESHGKCVGSSLTAAPPVCLSLWQISRVRWTGDVPAAARHRLTAVKKI